MKKRILFLNETSSIGGAENSLFYLIKYLDKDKYEPVVVLPEDGVLAKRLRVINIKVNILKLPKSIFLSTSVFGKRLYNPLAFIKQIFNMVVSLLRLYKFVRRERIDLIHSNSMNANMWWAAPLGVLSKIPVVWHVRDILPDGNKK